MGQILGLEYKGQANVKANVSALFSEKIADLDPASKTYREDVLKARKDALVEAIDDTGYATMQSTWAGQVPTILGRRSAQALGAIDDSIADVKEYTPPVYDSLSGEATPAPREQNEKEKKKQEFDEAMSDGLGVLKSTENAVLNWE